MKNCRIYTCACFVLQVERASSLTVDTPTSKTWLSLVKATERKCGGYQKKKTRRHGGTQPEILLQTMHFFTPLLARN